MASYGDLSDCYTIYFGATGAGRPSHRMVYRIVEERTQTRLEVIDIIAAEQRDLSYVYQLTSQRLKRLPDEQKPSFNQNHQQVLRNRSARRHRGL